MPRGQSQGAWKRANRSLEHLYDTPGSHEFPAIRRQDEHQKAVNEIVDSVVGDPPAAPGAGRDCPSSPARTTAAPLPRADAADGPAATPCPRGRFACAGLRVLG